MKKLWTIGEALIDFVPYNKAFLPVVGGAPANVAAAYAKLGGNSFFIGKISSDMFGKMIEKELKKANVNVQYLHKTSNANTGLCFVTLRADGEREFTLYRNLSADMLLDTADVLNISFTKNDILQFGSVDLVDMPVKEATDYLIDKIKKVGGILCFDPNVRKNTWNNLEEYRKTIKEYITKAHIIKISDEDCDFIYEGQNTNSIIKSLLKTSKIVLFTKGKQGSVLYSNDMSLRQEAYKIECIDTTGAGDSFLGAFLRYAQLFNPATYKTALQKAGAAATLVCSHRGVMTALPNEKALNDFLKNQ